MTVLKRVYPASAFKVGLVAYGILGLILGVFCSLIALGAPALGRHAHGMILGRFVGFGVLAIVVCPIVYGLVGGIAAVIGAGIYNLVAGWVGGLEVDIG